MKLSELKDGDKLKVLGWTWDERQRAFETNGEALVGHTDDAQALLDAFGIVPNPIEFETNVTMWDAHRGSIVSELLKSFYGKTVIVTVREK